MEVKFAHLCDVADASSVAGWRMSEADLAAALQGSNVEWAFPAAAAI